MSLITKKWPCTCAVLLILLVAELPAFPVSAKGTALRDDLARGLLAISRRELSRAHSFRTAAVGSVTEKRSNMEAWKSVLVTHANTHFSHDASVREEINQRSQVDAKSSRTSSTKEVVVGEREWHKTFPGPWGCRRYPQLVWGTDVVNFYVPSFFVRSTPGASARQGPRVSMLKPSYVFGLPAWHLQAVLEGRSYKRIYGSSGLLTIQFWIQRGTNLLLRTRARSATFGDKPWLRYVQSVYFYGYELPVDIKPPTLCRRPRETLATNGGLRAPEPHYDGAHRSGLRDPRFYKDPGMEAR